MVYCDYKEELSKYFGKERSGVHSWRLPFFDIAVVDLMLTLLVAVLVQSNFKILDKSKFKLDWQVFRVFVILMICGIFVHRLFCVNTTINKALFGEII